jgi:hypothetical protein
MQTARVQQSITAYVVILNHWEVRLSKPSEERRVGGKCQEKKLKIGVVPIGIFVGVFIERITEMGVFIGILTEIEI